MHRALGAVHGLRCDPCPHNLKQENSDAKRGFDPSTGIPPVPFNGISFVLGVGLACFWVLSKVRPTRILFAADSVGFLLLAASAFLDIASGRSSLLWLLWVPLPFGLRGRGSANSATSHRGDRPHGRVRRDWE